jgi:hypothetical protein
MEHEGSSPLSQKPATGPCPEPDESNPHPHALFKVRLNNNTDLQLWCPGDPLPSGFLTRTSYAIPALLPVYTIINNVDKLRIGLQQRM